MHLTEVRVPARSLRRFESVIGASLVNEALGAAEALQRRLGGRVIWNVNSTAVGGGVAEMLQSLLSYVRGAGINTRWLVIRGDEPFFRVTKRLHHALHGAAGDGSPLGEGERRIYEAALRTNIVELRAFVEPGDIVILHDPQTAGMVKALAEAGARVIWRCHIGWEQRNDETELGWRFLAPYLGAAHAFVFSRHAYVPPPCDDGRAVIIQPSIDVFSAKNQALSEETVRAILVHAGIVEGPMPEAVRPGFVRSDGAPGRVARSADVIRLGRAPTWGAPMVVQISRWDPLKDMEGVMRGFAEGFGHTLPATAELVLAGPNVHGVADDVEGPEVFSRVLAAWRLLPHAVRQRVHLINLPTVDVEENAAIVNALQRHATVIVQKSLREGFGLTVTEAMWKERPVIASDVGGIRDQIEDGKSGLLLHDPADLAGLGRLLGRVLGDPAEQRRLGQAARERVMERFLGVRHLLDYKMLIERCDAA
ncbi:MAG TPA: glycosyltransferase [Polyangia bacterium]|nr:glycosyltransferase [Polyangia bacterium]